MEGALGKTRARFHDFSIDCRYTNTGGSGVKTPFKGRMPKNFAGGSWPRRTLQFRFAQGADNRQSSRGTGRFQADEPEGEQITAGTPERWIFQTPNIYCRADVPFQRSVRFCCLRPGKIILPQCLSASVPAAPEDRSNINGESGCAREQTVKFACLPGSKVDIVRRGAYNE